MNTKECNICSTPFKPWRPTQEACSKSCSYRKHGMTNTRFYKVWASIKRRCNNPRQENYHLYGGRGIESVWDTFESFKEDMYESYLAHIEEHGEKDTTIERIDVDGNYCKENCRWATLSEQARNRRTTRRFEVGGVSKSMSDLAEEYSLTYDQLKLRMKRGWTIEKALSTPRLVNQYGAPQQAGAVPSAQPALSAPPALV